MGSDTDVTRAANHVSKGGAPYARRDIITLAAVPAVAVALAPSDAEGRYPTDGQRTIEERVRLLEDREEIYRLRKLYHYFVNEKKPEGFAQIYTPDATMTTVLQGKLLSSRQGTKELVEGIRTFLGNVRFVGQFQNSHLVELHGDRATGVCYLQASNVPAVGPNAGKSMIAGVKYDEVYVRTSAGWRIARSDVELYYFVPLDVGFAGNRNYFDFSRQ